MRFHLRFWDNRARAGLALRHLSALPASILRVMHSFRIVVMLCASLLRVVPDLAQTASPWQVQDSGTTASLRGIHSVNGAIAWVSGTGGTVLRTIDGGAHWSKCAVPDAATDGATLDFRGVEAWDAQSAIVMASGPGDKSRLYKTTDGCRTWQLLFKNPDAPDGFFDSFWLNDKHGILLGDPVRERVAVFTTENSGKTWKRDEHAGLSVKGRSLGAFAASNRCIAIGNALFTRGFAMGGKSGSVFFSRPFTQEEERNGMIERIVRKEPPWRSSPMPIASGSESAGPFAVAYRYPITTGVCEECGFSENSRFIAVGGDYTKPTDPAATAAWSSDGGWTWTASTSLPHGYRSAVQWSESLKAWIVAGTNGSDISRDDGKSWQPLDDGNWNALSLPFVVGPNGRIARLQNGYPFPK
jgi:hypothetical protein